MALRLKKGEVPKDAVLLTKSEAISHQWRLILNWKPQSDVWPFTHGVGLVGAVASITGMIMNLKFRSRLKLQKIGGISTLFSNSLGPGILAGMFQSKFIAEKTFLPIESCPLCLEMRAIAIQNVSAIGYPLILVPVSNFLLAIRTQTCRIPYYKNWKDLLFFCGQLYKPSLPSIAILAVVNSIAASFILYKQYDTISYINAALSAEEEPDPSTEELKDFF